MQYSTLFVSLLLSVAVTAQTASRGDEQTCKEMLKLNAVVQLANNQTKLDTITRMNATKIQEIQAQASKASTKLTQLQSNQTLMTTCAVVDAEIMTNSSCTQQFILQKFVDFAANDTLVTQTVNNDATKVADIELKASMAAAKLQQLQSNATLQAACPAVFAADECKMVKALAKFSELATNQTKLDKVAKGNTTRADQIKSAAALAGTQAMMLQANQTLMDSCKQLGISTDATSNKGTTDSNKSTSKSGAVVNGASASALLVGVLAAAVVML
ncbi:hypothetical protein CJF31_00003487 [Rutstroemia sp. NJR-2017a BVV2]|nr:hypothetical protein CJF31_00003487 [Rutstroemia sp. NJR-2017a BVV2]